ncbi:MULTISPECIES: A-adding tRNA nucleotidyltransferase [unclassified Synechocystis]|uniref:A-adding tRNA nucleotidyltransferase n=1 Tax=unclassified Synechocystis TaxID=2640012 RepID=UPI00040B638E|nr:MULTISPECIES: A-adding tRNA nucleotidyltransferase [unclassified Synechocystis]AIE74431.1 tRNA nucleotidyltransferase, A-adding [Synechocystis sp. PCC 6714]MCT0254799.1 CBS domain-containing protein [Synechocystis sp. CS-94]
MDLILCHQTADFDVLGAAVGLAKLHPGSRIVITGGSHPTVRQFLALHRNEFPLIELRSVNPDKIRSLYIVDNQQGDRLGKAAAWLTLSHLQRVAIYDHHLNGPRDIEADILEVEAVGASTTLIVEKLQRTEISLSMVEASVMALGIHVDTGSLTFAQTTVRDVKALAWLMEQGANLRLIAEYTDHGFPPPLQFLFAEAMQNLRKEMVRGYWLGSVLLTTESFVPGLSHLTERLLSLTECDALLLGHVYDKGKDKPRSDGSQDKTGVSNNQRFSLIGRTRIPDTDLTQLLEPYGGGGHAQAAAVNLRDVEPTEVMADIYQGLQRQIPKPLLARDFMSSPVRTIRPHTTIEQAQRILFRYGHSGLTVVNQEEKLVGIISRRDLDLALHHGFSHAPVKGYMTRNVKTIDPDTPLPRIEAIMVADDVGRLPVMDGDTLVGIVTRTDVLRQLLQDKQEQSGRFGDRQTGAGQNFSQGNLLQLLKTHLPSATWQLLTTAAQQAQARGWHLYLVGGAVRDLWLRHSQGTEKHQNITFQDIDLVVDGFHATADVGAGVELAQSLQGQYPGARLSIHGEFQTAALLWHKDPQLDSLWVDIATARTEFYPYPAANPEVEASSIRQDLYRRDFTINALSIRLTNPSPGKLLDFFGGMNDLQSQQVRVLHANSFIEDPTRIYRAVRFVVRLGFELEPQTEAYIRYAIASGVYERWRLTEHPIPALTTRLKAELSIILKAPYWKGALTLLADLDALKCLHPELKLTEQLWWQVRCLSRWLRWLDPERQLEHWLLRLSILLATLPQQERVKIATGLQLPKTAIDGLARLETMETAIAKGLGYQKCPKPSVIYQTLKDYDRSSLFLVAARGNRVLRKQIWFYFSQLCQVSPFLTGHDLKALGYKPGPQFKQILTDLLNACLDGKLGDRQREEAWLQTHYPLSRSLTQR